MDIYSYHNIGRRIQAFFWFMLFFVFVSLASCGGSGGGNASTFTVSGNVSGLLGTVVISNNGDDLSLSGSGSFTFSARLSAGDSYNVVVVTQPENQTCTVSNGSGSVVSESISNIVVNCVSPAFKLSGSYQSVPLIQVDSDINDVTARANVSNDTFLEAQTLTNFSMVHGFATKSGTGRIFDGDRFASSEDEYDVYRVNLQKNQTLRLQVVDYNGVDTFEGDLDLYLLDTGENLVASSILTSEFETIIVPSDGDYYIAVQAFSGSSKYTLSLGLVSLTSVPLQQSTDFIIGESIVVYKTSGSMRSIKASNPAMQFSHAQSARAALARFQIEVSSNTLAAQPIKTNGFEVGLKQRNKVSFEKIKTLQQIKRLNQRSDVAYAEPNYIYKPSLVPNDQYFDLQWHYPSIKLPQAWDITTGSRVGSDVIVAVVDTGVFLAHSEFSGQLISGYDFISDSNNARDGDGIDSNPDDPGDSAQLSSSSWHGTHVAGTVAARSNNTSGVAGVAWQAKIMPIRVLGEFGGSSYDIIQSIRYAAGLTNDSGTLPAQKADIINLSLGGGGFSQASQTAYNAVRAAGVLVVAAAGNENTSQLSYPASYEGVISVSATDYVNNRAPYSNFGTAVDVAAPGGSQGVDLNNDNYGDGVLSTLVDDSSGTRVGTYNFYQGTSMAAPHVAGVLALMRAVYPGLTPDEFDALLASGVITTDLGSAGRDDIYGYGLIDALKAVQQAQALENGGSLPTQPALIVSTPAQLVMGATSLATLVLTNEGDNSASVTSVADDADWLTVTEGTVDTDKLGEYNITIDRTGLNDSSYLGVITFNLSTGSTLKVQVTMDVGAPDKTGDAGSIYLLLIDENSNVVDQVTAIDVGGGIFDYSFTSVTAGNYRIVAGSDIDNDLFICQLAEACGGYPTIDALSTIEVLDDNISDLDFVIDILANFGSSSLNLQMFDGGKGLQRSLQLQQKTYKLNNSTR